MFFKGRNERLVILNCLFVIVDKDNLRGRGRKFDSLILGLVKEKVVLIKIMCYIE